MKYSKALDKVRVGKGPDTLSTTTPLGEDQVKQRKLRKRGKKAMVSFPEMIRLMNVYGSVKCLRDHNKNTTETASDDSIRRKFYRWFPDLEERFERDDNGTYHPRLGHEFEVNYREHMRKLDGEILSAKRTGSRKENLLLTIQAKGVKCSKGAIHHTPAREAGIVTVSSDDWDEAASISTDQDEDIIAMINGYDLEESADINMDDPLDMFFIAKKGIFDEVETCFFSPTRSPIPDRLELNSGNLISPVIDSRNPFIEDTLDKAIMECCDTNSDVAIFDDLHIDNAMVALFSNNGTNKLVSDDSVTNSAVVSWELFE